MKESLESILEKAVADTPPPKEKKLPRQYIPGFLRWWIKIHIYPAMMLDLAAQKIARWIIRPPYKKTGQCKRRGACCRYIFLAKKNNFLYRLQYLWSTQIQGFYPRDIDDITLDGKTYQIMGCRHLKKDGSCGNYLLRPAICRTWPLIEVFDTPRILKGCGYQILEKKNPLHVLQD